MFTSFFIVVIGLHVAISLQEVPLQAHTIDKRVSVTSDQIACISSFLTDELDDPSDGDCLNVATQLGSLYGSTDVVQSISTGIASFPEFCRPGCGQVLLNAWDSCNAYKDIEDVANLLIGMCASDRGSTCYSNYNELFTYLYDGKTCYRSLAASGVCLIDCSSEIRDGAQSYGCCVNVPIDYEDASEDIDNEVNTLFSECGVTRPTRCANSPLHTPSSAASHVATVMTVALHICISAIFAGLM